MIWPSEKRNKKTNPLLVLLNLPCFFFCFFCFYKFAQNGNSLSPVLLFEPLAALPRRFAAKRRGGRWSREGGDCWVLDVGVLR